MDKKIALLSNVNGRSDRFRYAKVDRSGKLLFQKTALRPELVSNLKRELLWADFLNHIARLEPDAHLRAPHIVGLDEGSSLLMEFIDAPLVAEPSDGAAWKVKIDRYARTLIVLDRYAEGYHVDWPTDSTPDIYEPEKIWHRWFGDRLDEAQPILQKALTIFNTGRDFLTFRVQHGDLTPWQMFEAGEEWIIYDGEKAGDHLPRYNDLAYGYGRLFTRLKDRETAARLLEKFLEYSHTDQNDFFQQFLPIMTLRATGMLADAYSDQLQEDYVNEALALLQLCFDGKIEDFLTSD